VEIILEVFTLHRFSKIQTCMWDAAVSLRSAIKTARQIPLRIRKGLGIPQELKEFKAFIPSDVWKQLHAAIRAKRIG